MKITVEKPSKRQLGLRLSDELGRKLDAIAEQNGVTVSRLIRSILERALDQGIEIEHG